MCLISGHLFAFISQSPIVSGGNCWENATVEVMLGLDEASGLQLKLLVIHQPIYIGIKAILPITEQSDFSLHNKGKENEI